MQFVRQQKIISSNISHTKTFEASKAILTMEICSVYMLKIASDTSELTVDPSAEREF